MKNIGIEHASLTSCVDDAQREQIVLTRGGTPVALIVGLEGKDAEQIFLGSDPAFWEMIAARRAEKTIDRAELDRELAILESRGDDERRDSID